MRKAVPIIFVVVFLLILYKHQHVQPVADPKDSPIFQQRLKSSIERSREDRFPVRPERMVERGRPEGRISRYPRPPFGPKELVVAGRCGNVTLTWVEEKRIVKENIIIKRRIQNREYSLIETKMIYERPEGQGLRYWISDSGLINGVSYEYLISGKDSEGKEVVKGPVSITLTCTEKDKEMIAQREKMIKEYYRKRGWEGKGYGAERPLPSPRPPVSHKGLAVAGTCGNVTLTWVEQTKVDRVNVCIKRRNKNGEYSLLKMVKIYEAQAKEGIRYWAFDSGLLDGETYEYLVSYRDNDGKVIQKGPVSITLTCPEMKAFPKKGSESLQKGTK